MLEKQLTEKITIVAEDKHENWIVESSSTAKNCKNYIREIVDTLDLKPNPDKDVIALSIGDPTVYGNLKPAPETLQAVMDVVQANTFNGYAPCVGFEKSRQAVADYLSHSGVTYTAKDIILCSGCSHAIEICISSLCDEKRKNNILMPRPGFSIYRTLAESVGVNVKYYDLVPDKNWEIDLAHLESQIDQNTAVIVVNNPSNPCGSVFSEQHLRRVLEIASTHRIPVIADEIYERIVFSENKFVSMASLDSKVPILVCGGLAKRFLVPGWRLGWIAIHDPLGAFEENVRKALISLSQRIIGSNTLVQGALPAILFNTPESFHQSLIDTLENNAKLAFECLQEGKGLIPYKPQGTMYMMIKVNMQMFPFKDILEFVVKLMEEESVFCLPGHCFLVPDFMRIVLTVPENLIVEGCKRILEFCNRKYKTNI